MKASRIFSNRGNALPSRRTSKRCLSEQPAKAKPAASQKNEPNTEDKNHENKGNEQLN